MNRYIVLTSFLILTIFACQPERQPAQEEKPAETATVVDPLPSWNDGEVKSDIMKFIEAVTTSSSADFVAIPDRIAVFDNDGTLWSEQPAYFQLLFAIDRIKAMAPDHPEWKSQQPFQAVLEGDMETVASSGMHGIMELVMTSHAGMTTDEFEAIVKDWIASARHPRFNQPYNQVIYKPMVELLTYLRENGFKTFIVSGGGIEFMRPWVEEAYGIPKDQVVGSSIKTKFEWNNGDPRIIRLPEIDFVDDKEGKPVGINRFIGRKPIFCAGNSDGDLQMMQWTASGPGKRMMLYLHHTDSVREWAYDRQSAFGRLDAGLDEAMAKGWAVINMKEDWKEVYPFKQ